MKIEDVNLYEIEEYGINHEEWLIAKARQLKKNKKQKTICKLLYITCFLLTLRFFIYYI